MNERVHQSVLLDEAINGLAIKLDGCYIDGTFGRGGHSTAILAHLGPEGRLIAIDHDPEAIAYGQAAFSHEPRLHLERGSFADMKTIADQIVNKPVDGVLLDLGVSSPQLDDATRGFSFSVDGPLDMRMDPDAGISAAEWVREVDEKTLANVIWEFGEERFSRRIARSIVMAREQNEITTTHQLAHFIGKAIPKWEKHKHPATRSFQAIRIFLNQELQQLQHGLSTALTILKPGGRLAVISFHSLEDRMVKLFMRREALGDPLLQSLPLSEEQQCIRLKLIGKAIKPEDKEVAHNPRARSAILRIGEKIR